MAFGLVKLVKEASQRHGVLEAAQAINMFNDMFVCNLMINVSE